MLNSFALDVSSLSQAGFGFVQNILRRSQLEHFHIVCSSLDPDLIEFIPHLLSSLNWSTLKSLELSGDEIDAWIQLWVLAQQQVLPQR